MTAVLLALLAVAPAAVRASLSPRSAPLEARWEGEPPIPPDGSCLLREESGRYYEVVSPREVPECAALLAYEADFERIRAAALPMRLQTRLALSLRGEDDAYYWDDEDTITVSTETLKEHGRESAALRWVLAHELGHAVQKRLGLLDWSVEPDEDAEEYLRRSRRLEGHADLVGQELLARAGFGPAAMIVGHEKLYGCDPKTLRERSDADTHPHDGARWLNSLVNRPLLLARKTAAALAGPAAGLDALETPVPAGRPGWAPRARIDDLDDLGQARRVRPATVPGLDRPYAELRAAPPPRAVDRWRFAAALALERLREAWYLSPRAQELALWSCGRLEDPTFTSAVLRGILPAAWNAMRLTLGWGTNVNLESSVDVYGQPEYDDNHR